MEPKTDSRCDGCRHSQIPTDGGYCYMFQDPPPELPCGQHDQFEAERRVMGSLVRKHPQILAMMIGAMSN